MRVGVIAIQHESNTFLTGVTTLKHFRDDLLLRGQDVREYFVPSHHELSGVFDVLDRDTDVDAVPLLAARARPSGTITQETCDALVSLMVAEIESAGPLDGMLVAPHGAAVCECHRDMDGHWLSILRDCVGAQVPIICTLDLHANVSRRMIDATDAAVAYRTNPHLDQRDRGIEAAKLLLGAMRGNMRPAQAMASSQIVINIERQNTNFSPCRELIGLAESIAHRPGVLSASAVLGYPYADVAEMGPSAIVVTDGTRNTAQSFADEVAGYIRDHGDEFVGQFVSIHDAVRLVRDHPHSGSPICLLDMGDNVGGGAPGDATALIDALLRAGIRPAFACLCDPAAVAITDRAPIGSVIEITVGGQSDPQCGSPLSIRATVVGKHEGQFFDADVRHGGATRYDMGLTSVVETQDGLTIMLTSKRTIPASLVQLTCCGLNPCAFRAIVAKGVHAPAAAYGPVCHRLIRVNTPGVTSADLSHFRYEHARNMIAVAAERKSR